MLTNMRMKSGDIVTVSEIGKYNVISGTGTANGLNILAHDSLDLSFEVKPNGGKYYTYHFGITDALSESESTTAINAAIAWLDGRTLHVPDNESLKYRGTILHPVCSIIGVRMPEKTSDNGALKNGSIFVGSMRIKSLEVTLKNFGVDAGVDNNPSTAADALAVTTETANIGLFVNMTDIIGLGRHPDDAYHAIRFCRIQLFR